MFQIKIIIFILILGIAGGGYVYVQKLRADNATLKINTTKLESAVSQNEQVIQNQIKEFEQVRTTLEEVQTQKDALQGDKDNLEKKLQNANRCIEIATGSPLTEEELAATKKSQINGECPSLANPNYVLQ